MTRQAIEARTIARLEARHPGASWHFLNHATAGRVLVCVPPANDAPAPLSILEGLTLDAVARQALESLEELEREREARS